MWSDIIFASLVAIGAGAAWLLCKRDECFLDEDETEANAMTPGRYDDKP